MYAIITTNAYQIANVVINISWDWDVSWILPAVLGMDLSSA